MTAIAVTVIFVVLMLIGTPMFTVLGMSTVGFSLFSDVALTPLPGRVMQSLNSFTLLAIPFFMIAGEIMAEGDLAGKMVKFLNSLIGHIRGGLAYVVICLNIILAGMSGSANADTAATCSILLPMMDKEKYERDWSGALIAASGTMGPIIPPSIGFVVYAGITGVSVGKLFQAGIIPGLLMAVAFFFFVGLYAHRHNLPKHERATGKEIWESLKKAILSLLMPLIILGSIFTGFVTATESAVLALVYAFIVTKFVYKTLTWKKLAAIIKKVMLTVGATMSIFASAALFGWMLSYARVPQLFQATVLSLTDNKIIFFIILNLLMLVLGCLMEGTAIKLILVPILLPLLEYFGMNLIQFGVVIELNLMIGLITPPVGMSLFLIAKLTEVPIVKLVKQLLPYMLCILAVLLLVTYIPDLTLWLPSILGT